MDPDVFLDLAESIVDWHRHGDLRHLPPAQRLNRLCELIGSRLEDYERAGVNHGIVYLVLNHARWDGGRHFVAWLDGSKVPPMVEGASAAEGPPPADAVVVVTGPTERRSPLHDAWLRVWADYQRTSAALAKMELTTWNHLVLEHARSPRPLGLAWGDVLRNHRHYVALAASTLAHVGIDPTLAAGADGARFLALEHEEGQCPLAALEKRLERLEPVGLHGALDAGDNSRLHALAACVSYHLLRSYAVWGGTAFISLPALNRAPDRGAASVLSLCSTEPLPIREVLNWSHLASIILSPIAGEEKHALLLTRADLDEPLPRAMYDLVRQRLGRNASRTLDEVLWSKKHHAKALFTNEVQLRNLEELEVRTPAGLITLAPMLRNLLGLATTTPTRTVAEKATLPEHESEIAAVHARLKGDLEDRLDLVCALAEQILGDRGAKPTIGNLDIDKPPLIDGRREHRFWVSARMIKSYLDCVRRGMPPIEPPPDVRVKMGLCDPSRPDLGVWILVINTAPQLEIPSRRGQTPAELRDCAEALGARSCFDGLWDPAQKRFVGSPPRIHYPTGTAAGHAVTPSDLVGGALVDLNSSVCVFVNCIVLPIFRMKP